ncbi:cytochrome C-type biogenesis protein CcmF (mitochondrion) [Cyanidioschyzon merolae]|jgi:cytochrome c-type biogenesis protein CcmF|uniref:Cytochrome C-type biogenesis protein CcmF n=1 Tax=Cyanidioschyzon merolae TaxID=45157 RepID=A0A679F184_CYAME|nr:cytochrome C-type biogenesis protein CcmF [Cyanidioschyzon merolae]
MFGYVLHFLLIFIFIYSCNFFFLDSFYKYKKVTTLLEIVHHYYFYFNYIYNIIIIIIWLIGIILLLSDFSILFVVELSSVNQPSLYKLITLWSNNEGSLFLGYFLQFIIYFTFINYFINKLTLIVKLTFFYNVYFILFNISFLSLTLLLIFLRFDFFFNFTVLEGNELNFLLQDINILIHPPLIYISYASYSIIFSISFTILIIKCKFYVLYILRFLNLIGWFIASFSILLGSRWAYTELGWGGFWFWDSVEIISLLPWLLSLALLHSLLLNLKFCIIRLDSLFLGMAIYFVIIIGIILVRSGLLQSVHTFVNSPNFLIIFLYFFLVFIFILIVILLKKYTYFTSIFDLNNHYNFVYYIFLLVILYFLYLLFVLYFPFLIKCYNDNALLFSFGFFNKILLLFIGILLTLIIIFLINSWKLIFIFLGIIIIVVISGFPEIFLALYFFIYLLLFTLILIIKQKFSFIVYHFNFFFIMLSLLLITIYGEEFILNFSIGKTLLLNDNFIIIFRDLNHIWSTNYLSTYGNFLITDFHNPMCYENIQNVLFSEKRFYLYQSLINTKSIIYTNLMSDVYILLGDGNFENGWYSRILFMPFISWFWLGGIFLLVSIIFSLFRCIKNFQ